MNYFKELYDKNELGYVEVEYEFFGGRLLTRLFVPLKSLGHFKTEYGKLLRQDVKVKESLLKKSNLGELYGGVLSVAEVKEVGVIMSGQLKVISVRASEEVIVSQLEVEDFKRTIVQGESVDEVIIDNLTYIGSEVVSEFLDIVHDGRYETELIEFFNILGEETARIMAEEIEAESGKEEEYEYDDEIDYDIEDFIGECGELIENTPKEQSIESVVKDNVGNPISIKGIEKGVLSKMETESKTGVMQGVKNNQDANIVKTEDSINLELDLTVKELFELYLLLDESKLPNKETIKGKIRSKYLGS